MYSLRKIFLKDLYYVPILIDCGLSELFKSNEILGIPLAFYSILDKNRSIMVKSKIKNISSSNIHFLGAIATLIGMIIGAGVFGIPYVVNKAGIFNGIILIIIIGLAILILNLYVGEIILRTKGNHGLTGYADIYLGSTAKKIMLFSMMISLYGALTAYIIGESQIISTIFNINQFYAGIIFFVVMAFIVHFGIEAIEKSELLLSIIFIILFIVLGGVAFYSSKFSTLNFAASNWTTLLIPYGVILFAYGGMEAIPTINEELKDRKDLLKKTILWGSIIPIGIYLLFTISVLGVTGSSITEVASLALGDSLGKNISILANLIAMFSMSTSFLGVGFALKQIFIYDYNIKELPAWLLVISIPLMIVTLGFRSFTGIISLAGAIGFGITGIMVIMMHYKAKKLGNRKPEYEIPNGYFVSRFLMLMFILGISYSVYMFFF